MAVPTPAPSGSIPDPIKSGISTAIITFLTLLLPSLTGFLSTLYGWASSHGHQPLPGISTLGYAAVAAGLSALGGLGVTLFRWAQQNWSWIPGNAPTWVPPTPPTSPPVVLTASQADLDAIRHEPPNAVQALVEAVQTRRQTIASAQADLDALQAALANPEG